MKILVINGPNLNFLGIRQPDIYGRKNYGDLVEYIEKAAADAGVDICVFQSNSEGEIIDKIQESYFDATQGLIINPGAYTHYSYAIYDALLGINIPKVEVHLSNIKRRERFRRYSVTAPACDRQIMGKGFEGYAEAINFIQKQKKC